MKMRASHISGYFFPLADVQPQSRMILMKTDKSAKVNFAHK